MEIKYVFTQKRREFGSPCRFTDVGPHLLVDIPSNASLDHDYITLPRIDNASMCRSDMSCHEVNTETQPTEAKGMNHEEGGWPADVDHRDEDQVGRFKKKLEKDEGYISTIKNLANVVEELIMENNAINIYEEFFHDESTAQESFTMKVHNVYRDVCNTPRSVYYCAWHSDGRKMAASYNPRNLGSAVSRDVNLLDCYVWEIDDPITPYYTIKADNVIHCFSFSNTKTDSLIGGYDNGQIALWDIRKTGRPIQLTPTKTSHMGVVSDVQWIDSKCGTEFISVSGDGQIMSWDIRNLDEPTSKMTLAPTESGCSLLKTKHSITCVCYDETVPDEFLIGTNEGLVACCNRRFVQGSEKIVATYDTDAGPILCIERSPFLPKLLFFATALEIFLWSEDYPKSPLLRFNSHNGYVTDSCWCRINPSIIYVTKTTGCIEVWDILLKQNEPINVLNLEIEPVTCVMSSEKEGKLTCGAFTGNVYLLLTSASPESDNINERLLVASMVDREIKKEQMTLPKQREERLKDQRKVKEIEEAERKKELQIPLTWVPEEKAEDLYEELFKLEFGSGFLSKKDIQEDEDRRARALNIEPEFGEDIYLDTLEREVQTKNLLERTLVEVVTKVESDNSRFPFKEVHVDEEFGEQDFLDDLERVSTSSNVIDDIVDKVSEK